MRDISLKKSLIILLSGIFFWWSLNNLSEIGKWVEFIIGVFSPLTFGLIIAFIFNITMRFYEKLLTKKIKKKGVYRAISIVLVLLTYAVVLTLIVLIIIPEVNRTVDIIKNQFPAFVDNATGLLDKLLLLFPELTEFLDIDFQKIISEVTSFVTKYGQGVLTSAISMASGFFGGIVTALLSLIFAIYILVAKEDLKVKIANFISAYTPKKVSSKIEHVYYIFKDISESFITGQVTEAIILGALFFIVLTIFGFPYTILISVLIFVTALIPIVGAFIACFIGACLILIQSPMQAVWFVILFLIVQQIEGNLIYPKVVGSSVGLPALWVLFSVTVGGGLFGVVGMIVFIPVVSVIYRLLGDDIKNRLLAKIPPKIDDDKEDKLQKEEVNDVGK